MDSTPPEVYGEPTPTYIVNTLFAFLSGAAQRHGGLISQGKRPTPLDNNRRRSRPLVTIQVVTIAFIRFGLLCGYIRFDVEALPATLC
jgi:hypothetical protein